ncbi:MAG: hypothetical protein ACUZ8I_07800 [Candidatus Scalindua sp.]
MALWCIYTKAMKPITHLLGDRVVAQRYLWFAEKKMAELKMVMGLQNLEFGQRMYRLPNDSVEVHVESYLGVDKIRIAAAIEEGVRGNAAIVFPSASALAYGIEWYSIGVWLFGNGRANMTAKIWDSSGAVEWASQTHDLGISIGATFISIPLTTILGVAQYFTIFSNSNQDYFYGMEFEHISGTINILAHVSGDPGFKGDSGSPFWSVADAGVLSSFLRKRSDSLSRGVSWVGSSPDSPFVTIFDLIVHYFIIAHRIVPFPKNISFVVSSSSVTNTKIACKVEHDSIIQAGRDTGETILR